MLSELVVIRVSRYSSEGERVVSFVSFESFKAVTGQKIRDPHSRSIWRVDRLDKYTICVIAEIDVVIGVQGASRCLKREMRRDESNDVKAGEAAATSSVV